MNHNKKQELDNLTQSPEIHLNQENEDTVILGLSGSWKLHKRLPAVEVVLKEINARPNLQQVAFDSEYLENWDNGLLVFLRKLSDGCARQKVQLDTAGLPKGVTGLLRLATAVPVRDTGREPDDSSLLSRIGDVSIRITKSSGEILGFLGDVAISFGKLLRGKARFRRTDLTVLIQETGVQALPIVSLINFLLGMILAFVGSVQLRQFGAEIFVADLVAIAMVREMGAMMTAIIMAGRSGAAFAAQLGTMMVNEEIDALKTSGFSPIDYLVLPRIMALGLMMPLLVLYADFIGILGGMLVGMGLLDLSFVQYFEETRKALTPNHFLLGLIKASIYGFLVAMAGCMHGIQSGRNASAVGAATTAAVVYGIVLIIVANAVTTVIFSVLGV